MRSHSAYAQINAEQVMRVGVNALYFEDFMLSIQYFNKAIEAKPHLARPYFYRAIAKLNLDDYAGAEADATEAIERNPFLADAYEVRGVARQNLGDNAGAVSDYDKALQQLPENRGIMFNRALALSEDNRLQEALEAMTGLITSHPGFDSGYTGRAKVYMALGDTLSAKTDLDKAVELNKNSANAYILRADIAMNADHDYAAALDNMNEAIKLQPKVAGYFINRAFLRYNLNDYFGAMADYDYAVTLDPTNATAYFNRGILRAEVSDNDRAVDDFTMVLKLNPNDMRALFNRSRILAEKHEYQQALEDLDRVIAGSPEFSGLLFERFDILNKMGRRTQAMQEYDRAMAMSKAEQKQIQQQKLTDQKVSPPHDEATTPESSREETEAQLADKFMALLTMEPALVDDREYNNKSIRGKIQDRDASIAIEPDFYIGYYSAPTQLAQSTLFMPEVNQLNESRILPMYLQVLNQDIPLDDEEEISRHFELIDHYNSIIAAEGTARAIDYFGRAMEHFTLHNFDAAIVDLNHVITVAPDFSPAWLMRAVSHHRSISSLHKSTSAKENRGNDNTANVSASELRPIYMSIISDYDTLLALTPRNPYALFNKGNIYLELGDLTAAISCYTEAINLDSTFGQAYYNRGYCYFRLGNRQNGVADLSRAGELGIIPSYNLLKRLGR